MISERDASRDRYHVAKLALFNIRLLHELQQKSNPIIAELIASVANKNGFRDVPLLLHQGSFLQFSYVCLVWLWESAKKAKLENALLDEFPSAAKRIDLTFPAAAQIKGERELKDWKSVLALLRNALSHGKVEISEHSFTFSDQNTFRNPKESAPTHLELSWEQLSKISETCIHALTPVLWPGPPIDLQVVGFR